jgi:phospholipid transport system substrate-binding protein
MKRRLVGFSILMILLFSVPAYAGVPQDMVQTNVNSVLDVLRDPALKPASAKETKKQKLRAIYDRMFNQVELSKRAMGRNWSKLNAAQQQEFVKLFRQVLEKAYIDKILAYTDEKITFEKESMLSETQAEVQTKAITSSKTIPISYRLILQNGAWGVYDVVIENVSLVQNYRTQFNDILAKNTPEQLLETLRKKVKDQDAKA